jgi:hypothetical protein
MTYNLDEVLINGITICAWWLRGITGHKTTTTTT